MGNSSQPLPPSSLHSFHRLNLSIGGLFISDFETSFKNNFYHSIFDTADNLKIDLPENITEQDAAIYTTKFGKRLQGVITSLAKSIYTINTNEILDDQADQTIINQLVYCFYRNVTCDYFRSIMSKYQWNTYLKQLDSTLPKGALSFYTSVNDGLISGKLITQILLRYFTRNTLFDSLNSTECSKYSNSARDLIRKNNVSITDFIFVNNVTCVASELYAVSSVSPAFDKLDDGVLVETQRFSAWTESNWPGETVQMRLFVFTNDVVRISAFVVGFFATAISVLITIVLNKYSDKLFSFNNSAQNIEIIE